MTVDNKNHSYAERSRIPFQAIENKMNSLNYNRKMELTNPDSKMSSQSNLNNTLKVIRRNDSQDSKKSKIRFEVKEGRKSKIIEAQIQSTDKQLQFWKTKFSKAKDFAKYKNR